MCRRKSVYRSGRPFCRLFSRKRTYRYIIQPSSCARVLSREKKYRIPMALDISIYLKRLTDCPSICRSGRTRRLQLLYTGCIIRVYILCLVRRHRIVSDFNFQPAYKLQTTTGWFSVGLNMHEIHDR